MQKKVYLDHSATTPLDQEVFQSMQPFFFSAFGNASSNHVFGKEANSAITEARKTISNLLNATPEEIYFLSGGTEADNLAVKGFVYKNRQKGNHIITTPTEHPAVLNTCLELEKEGFDVSFLPVDKYGQVDPEAVKKAIKRSTILISVIHGNNEIGTINPIREIGQIAGEVGVAFHTDAVQSFGKIPINVEKMNISLLSISGHKFYGPKGTGVLYIRKGISVKNLLNGGSHEKGIRPGTENVPGIVGMAKAAQLSHDRMSVYQTKIGNLRNYFQEKLLAQFEDVKINGHPTNRLYHNLNVCFPGFDSGMLLAHMDKFGIAASNGSACASHSIEPSHVLRAIGLTFEEANSSIRFTLGKDNTREDIDYVLTVLESIVRRVPKANII